MDQVSIGASSSRGSNSTADSTSATLTIERERGFPIRIQCVSSPEEIETLTLFFEYEFAIVDPRESIAGEVIAQDLPSLEYFLLHHTAREIGLLSCDDDSRRNHSVIALANLQPDKWERDLECTELTNLSPDLICIQLRGIMQASFITGMMDEEGVETMLTETISTVLNGDDIRTQGIVDTMFIESRVIEDPRQADASTAWKPLPALLGTSLSAIVVFGGIGIFLLNRRRRRKKQQNQISEIIPDIPIQSKVVTEPEDTEHTEQRDAESPTAKDQEVPSVDPLVLSIATTRTASETIVDTDDSLNLQDGSLNSRAHVVVPTKDPLTVSNPPAVINLQPRPKAADGTALIRPPPKPPLPAGKPPASPRGPPSTSPTALSKPLKQRRRKKRKKKPKVVRMNSRERINEMETITETAEEEGSDSEYSWYSETDSNASSRDVSPSRESPVPSTTSSEDQLMVQLRQSLDSPSQQLLSCSSKDDEDSDGEGDKTSTAVPTAGSEESSSSSKGVSSSSSGDSNADGEIPTNATPR